MRLMEGDGKTGKAAVPSIPFYKYYRYVSIVDRSCMLRLLAF
jgi:hypothetical protein